MQDVPPPHSDVLLPTFPRYGSSKTRIGPFLERSKNYFVLEIALAGESLMMPTLR
jgi:hypothetical protein